MQSAHGRNDIVTMLNKQKWISDLPGLKKTPKSKIVRISFWRVVKSPICGVDDFATSGDVEPYITYTQLVKNGSYEA